MKFFLKEHSLYNVPAFSQDTFSKFMLSQYKYSIKIMLALQFMLFKASIVKIPITLALQFMFFRASIIKIPIMLALQFMFFRASIYKNGPIETQQCRKRLVFLQKKTVVSRTSLFIFVHLSCLYGIPTNQKQIVIRIIACEVLLQISN